MERGGSVALWAALIACLPEDRRGDGGQFGEENGSECAAVERLPLAIDDVSPLGFAPADVLTVVVPSEPELRWADGRAAVLALEPDVVGPVEFVDYEWGGDGAAERAGTTGCEDRVEIGVRLGFRTDDGAFDERLDLTLAAVEPARADGEVVADEITGNFDPWTFAPGGNDYDAVTTSVTFGFSSAGSAGTVSGLGSGTEGDLALAEQFPIASWAPATE